MGANMKTTLCVNNRVYCKFITARKLPYENNRMEINIKKQVSLSAYMTRKFSFSYFSFSYLGIFQLV